jgi:hypothetical protein
MNRYFYLILVALLCTTACSRSCGDFEAINEIKPPDEGESKAQVDTTERHINTDYPEKYEKIDVVLYIENSASMAGFVSGSDFKQTLASLITSLHTSTSTNLKIVYIGSNSPSKSDKTIVPKSAFSTFAQNLNAETFNKSTTAFGSIFRDILKTHSDSSVSILLTDNIISTLNSAGQKDPSTGVIFQENEIRAALENAVRQDSDFSYLLAKLSSKFTGNYFDKNDHPIYLPNEERPYCITLLGKSNLVNEIAASCHFFNVHGLNIQDYKKFVKKDKDSPMVEFDVISSSWSNYSTSDLSKKRIEFNKIRGGNIKLTLGVKTNGTLISDNYIKTAENYIIQRDKYEIKAISNSTVPEYDYTIDLEAKVGHSELEIRLKDTLPAFVAQTHTNNDTDITSQPGKIFGFSSFIRGIDNAFRFASGNEYKEAYGHEIIPITPKSRTTSNFLILFLVVVVFLIIFLVIKKRKHENQ